MFLPIMPFHELCEVLFFLQKLCVFFGIGVTASGGPCLRQPHAYVGVQPLEQPLAQATGKEPFEKLIEMISGTQAIAMAYKERLPSDQEVDRFMVNRDPQLSGKIIEHPHIVIARKENDGDAFVS